MDLKDIKLLIKMVTETDITEFELEGAEEKIRIKRGINPGLVQYQAPLSFPMPMTGSPFMLNTGTILHGYSPISAVCCS